MKTLKGLMVCMVTVLALVFFGCAAGAKIKTASTDQVKTLDIAKAIKAKTPAPGDSLVKLDAKISVTFKKEVLPVKRTSDSTTVFLVQDLSTNNYVAGTTEFDGATAIFTPILGKLKPATTYQLTVQNVTGKDEIQLIDTLSWKIKTVKK
jgi:hypothetical protein